MSDRNPTFCRELVKTGKDLLSRHPEVLHEWSIDADEDHCILDIPKKSEDGFDITFEVYPEEIMVMAGGAHTQLSAREYKDKTVETAFGLLRDLLTKNMRVREKLSNGKPYSWSIESIGNGKWNFEESNTLFFWNYFGKKTEKIYSNDILPVREF